MSMKESKKISVIIPVHNTEKYLNKCVSSVVHQKYSNLEIILVENGSNDNSLQICNQWAQKDQRIQVFHEEITGAGHARNIGMQKAAGDYIGFIDSDDYISEDMYAWLVSIIGNYDMAECSFVNISQDDYAFEAPDKSENVKVFNTEQALKEHLTDHYFKQLIWNKLYKKGILSGVVFPENSAIDDEFFTYRAIGNARTLVRSDARLYAYRNQTSSIMHSLNTVKRMKGVEAKLERHRYIKKNFPDLCALSAFQTAMFCVYEGQLEMRQGNHSELQDVMKTLAGTMKSVENDIQWSELTSKEKMWLYMAYKSLQQTCKIRNTFKIGL